MLAPVAMAAPAATAMAQATTGAPAIRASTPAIKASAAAATTPALALSLAKSGLRLLDAQGRVVDEFSVRAKRWDRRALADGTTVALLQDADSGALRLIEVRGDRLRERARWAAPAVDVEAVCLYLEPRQQTLQAFLLGSDGLSEQWLLTTPSSPTRGMAEGQVLRLFAAVPDAKACAVRDDEGTLYVAESDVGLWAFNADPERAGRELVAPGLAPQDLPLWLEARASRLAPVIPVAVPSAQTEPVRGAGDAADDPAIWVHASQPARSRILGTDKKRGLAVYDLQGRETQFLPVGRVNNVDLRQRLRYDGRDWDLAVATQRDQRSVLLFGIDAAGRVKTLAELPTGLEDVYGICSARNPAGGLDVFVNDKDGRLIQLRVARKGGGWTAAEVASLKLATQPEGCVADEAGRQFFVGEEKRGLWRVALDADGKLGDATLILPVGETLHADVEGMAVHRGPRGAWLVVSSQGNDSYVVLDADAPHAVKGRFRIGLNAARGIDGVSETDGLDVTSTSLGGEYGEGLLVVQDGHKRWPMGRQNFKLVPWGEVVRVIEGSGTTPR
ncbi:hypothetical protein CDN99_21070 [Roseateles aquatilis]|uniref:BPP domain-containing protein n=2 Tax=Roseateles aquatilis TaxID=431061 RepID=A0A246J1B7_9BURK|nr:hypothetical protein CDN99_21070 [Roseateles aquatilis]